MIKNLLLVLAGALLFMSCENDPEAGNTDKVIFIHASEGGYSKEKTSYDGQTKEKDITLTFSRELKRHLENKGYEVILTESDNSVLTYDEIKNQAPGKKIAALLHIRTGWSPDKLREKVSGVKIYYSRRITPSKHLDSLISNSMYVHSNIMARNLGMRNSIILNLPDIPGISMELGNINNKDDLAKMLSTSYRGSVINAIAYALDDFLKMY